MLAPCLLALALVPAADPKPRLDADGIPLPAEELRYHTPPPPGGGVSYP